MALLSRVGDHNGLGGKIIRGAATVICNGRPVGLHPSPVTPHPKGKPHKFAFTTSGSLSVICEGSPVLKVGVGLTCGHRIVTGSTTVIVS